MKRNRTVRILVMPLDGVLAANYLDTYRNTERILPEIFMAGGENAIQRP